MAKNTVVGLRAEMLQNEIQVLEVIKELVERIHHLEVEVASLKAGAQKPQQKPAAKQAPKGTVPFIPKPTQALVVKPEEGRTLLNFEKDFYLANRQWCYETLRAVLTEANALGHRTDWEKGSLVVHHRA